MRDFYSILGVKRDAGDAEIKAAWRTKAKSIHPDQNRDDPNAHNRFAEIGRAYEVLKDPAKRTRYDQQRSKLEALEREQTIMQQRQAAREAAERAKQAKANAERIMAELAAAEAEKAKADAAVREKAERDAAAARAKAEKDKAAREAAAKAKSEANTSDPKGQAQTDEASAPHAGKDQGKQQAGQNAKPDNPEEMVSHIFGDSPEAAAAAETLKREQDNAAQNDAPPLKSAAAALLTPIEIFSSFVRLLRGAPAPMPEKAPDIFAEALVAVSDLLEQTSVPITLNDGREVRVPLAGATDGHIVRLKGQGLKIQGMQRGDLAVTVKAIKTERFSVDGFDLRTILPITLENAVLGWETEIEGPQGPVQVAVPAWSNSDQLIRIDNLGLPDGHGGRGALVVELRVMLWEKPDEKVTDLMRVMREGLFL